MAQKTWKLALLLCGGVLNLPAVEAGERLGRLFFTPERRQHLDYQRQMNIQPQAEAPQDPTLTINGVVVRSSGKRTIWVNGVAQDENNAPGDVAIVPLGAEPGRVAVQAADVPAAQARVGDTVNRNTGEAAGLLGDGTLRVGAARQKK